jgi:ABC-type transport system substrate-binding protein
LLRLVPREIVDDESVGSRPVGSGPWIFDALTPGVEMRWRRNPAWHEDGFPRLDEVRATFVDDAASVVDQLEAKTLDWSRIAIDSYEPNVRGARSLETAGGPDNSVGGFFFDYGTPPWNDVRVRQALSMSLHRAAILDRLDGSGRGTLQTALPALAPFYLDPQSDDFGPNGQYFRHRPLMARQLLEAAGLSGGVPLAVTTAALFEERFGRQIEYVLDSARSAGFDPSVVPLEYGTYLTTVFRGNFPHDSSGVGLGPLKVAIDPDEVLFSVYHWQSERHNWGPGPGSPAGDTAWLDAFDRQRAEQDGPTRVAQVHDLQREMAEQMYVVPWMSAPELWLRGEWVHDLHVRGGMGVGREVAPYAWIDPSRDS